MKNTTMRVNGLVAALVATLVTACSSGSGIEGEYIGVEGDSLIESITLGSDGVASVVYPMGFGTSGPGSYTVEGNTVYVTVPSGETTTMEIDANGCLTHFFVGTYCRNGAGSGSSASRSGSAPAAAVSGGAEAYIATTAEGRIQLELLSGGTARMTMTPFGGGGSGEPQRMSFDLSYQVRGSNVVIEMPGEGPTELTRSGRDLLMTSDGETARFIRQ
ncbi:MAG: hypothetical protein WBN32_10275 [Woeseia sp.]